MNTSPAISIIVPIYNAESTLQECIESIINQNYKDFELILVDDGSVDNSYNICSSYARCDERITVVHQKNQGVSVARNTGLDIAKGQWITFIDSDDYIEQDYFFEGIDDSVDLVMLCIKDLFVSDDTIRQSVSYSKNKYLEGVELNLFLKEYIDSILFRTPWSKLFKRSIIGSLRFHKDMTIAEDSCFVLSYLSGINRLMQIHSGSYVVRTSSQTTIEKYGVSVEKAIMSLQKLQLAYEKVESRFHIGHGGFYSYLGFFKMLSVEEWKRNPSRWYSNNEVKEIYKYVWPDLSFKQKMALLGSFIIRNH